MSDALDLSILLPALLAGLLVLSTHVPLGIQVLQRGIIFIDLAVAQMAALGVIAAYSLGWEPNGLAVQLVALGAAVAGAAFLYYTERRFPDVQEALIGAAFILAASAGILLLAANPHSGEYLKDLLVGQILWVSATQLGLTALVYAAILVMWFSRRAQPAPAQFYILFALAVTASVQLVGIYLVFASLIFPALATRKLKNRSRLVWGYVVGAIGYAIGIFVSALIDLPTGALIVWTLAAATLVMPWALALRKAP